MPLGMTLNYLHFRSGGFLLHQQPAVLQTGLNSGGPHPNASVRTPLLALQNTGLLTDICIPTVCLQVDALLHCTIKGSGRTDVLHKYNRLSSPPFALASQARKAQDGDFPAKMLKELRRDKLK